jgi:hypothetical protein
MAHHVITTTGDRTAGTGERMSVDRHHAWTCLDLDQ